MFKTFIAALAFLLCLPVQSAWAVGANFAVIADPHFYDTDLGSSGEAFEAYLESDRKMLLESEAILNSAVTTIKAKGPDFLIVAGDLTKDGALSSHEKFAQYLADLEADGIQVFVVPGNHDINNPHAYSYEGDTTTAVDHVSAQEFEILYADYGYSQAIYRDDNSLSYVAEPVEGLWLFSIDSCKYDDNIENGYPETSGAIEDDTMAWILEKMAEARANGKQVIGVMHHGVTEHYSNQSAFFSQYLVDDWEEVSTTLAGAGMQFVFTGHYHANDVAQSTPDNQGPSLFDIETGSLVTYPSPFRFITIMDDKAAVHTEYVTDIDYDTGDLSFTEYASDFLYQGILTIAESLLVSTFGTTEETAAYVAPLAADAFFAHYSGDETPDDETLATIESLQSSSDYTYQLIGMMLDALWTDLPTADNSVFLDASSPITLLVAGTYDSSAPMDEGGAEILTFDPDTQRLFVSNAYANTVEVLDASTPSEPGLIFSIDLSPYGAGVNSVAVDNGILAVAVEADPKQDPGSILFFDAQGNYINQVAAGALPDMVTFTPDGTRVLCANEGEPSEDYATDPQGSITIVDLSAGAAAATAVTVDFTAFDELEDSLKEEGVRIFGPDATVSKDLEPEYIAVSEDGTTAWITCQENNAMAVLDIDNAVVTDILPLTYKDHSQDANGLDPSNKDDAVTIETFDNLLGMIQPDAVAAFQVEGITYLITANEGDAREYEEFEEAAKVSELTLDPASFPAAATLQENDSLGKLKVTTTLGDTDDDGDYDALYTFGGRSFSIFMVTQEGLALVFDSGDQLEQITAAMLPDNFNSDNDDNDSFDSRSDNKGPEPEGLALGTIGDAIYAFIGLERIGGIMVYDITDPLAPEFVQYINNRDFSVDADDQSAGDLAPEGLVFIPAQDSPNSSDLLGVANEVSGTTTLYTIESDQAFEGDIDGDSDVDLEDISLLRIHLSQPADTFPDADFNGDGTINASDLRTMITNCTYSRCASN